MFAVQRKKNRRTAVLHTLRAHRYAIPSFSLNQFKSNLLRKVATEYFKHFLCSGKIGPEKTSLNKLAHDFSTGIQRD